MVQIPDSVRPALAIFAKYHFWMLAAIVPVALVPVLFMANGKLRAEIQSHRGRIDGKFSGLRNVDGQNPHPNEAWSTKIVANTKSTKRETLAAWSALWQSQQQLRQWPAALGDEFVRKAAALKPDGTLPRKMLERYQEIVRQLVRDLPKRMNADDHMRDESAEDAATAPGGQPPGPRPQRGLVDWSADDQRAVYEAFNWLQTPSTPQVVLAQEELWAYGLLCNMVMEMNKTASGRYNAAITTVSRLAVGYPAAEDIPGCSGRIISPEKAAGEALPPPPAAAPRPQNPRFGGKTAAAPPPGDPGEGGGTPDDPLQNWVYVDFDGKPLLAAEIVSNPAAQMVHLLPFVMRITIDQRSLDSLLVKFASSSIPIEVRQLRINPDAATAPTPTGGQAAAPASGQAAAIADRPRLHDIRVELRGTICLATPPNPALIGLEPADLEATEGQPANAPPAVEGEQPVAVPAPPVPVEAAP